MGQVLNNSSILDKLNNLEAAVNAALLGKFYEAVPEMAARDVLVVSPQMLPPKLGLSTPAGQSRLMHDLASIELQAMELGLRSLIEYPDADPIFREQLAKLVIDEGRHLRLCLEAIAANGGHWGQVPVQMSLWSSVSKEDSLLDRLLIVHRYLEGSGLDAGDTILRRLDGMPHGPAFFTMQTIRNEEVGHVQFGSYWYHSFCKEQKLDSTEDFKSRMQSLHERLPRRLEPIRRDLRLLSGFNEAEIQFLEERRLRFLRPREESATGPLVNQKV